MDDSLVKTKKGHLLLIDDDPGVLQIIGTTLADEGYKLTFVTRGRTGLKAAKDELPDLILLHVKLSDLDGIEVCRLLKRDERTSAIPVIFISGLGHGEDKIRGFEAGGVDYIAEPFGVGEVLARVSTHLAISRSSKQIESQNARLEQEILRSRQAEERNRRLAEEWEATFDSMTDLVMLQDPDQAILRVNKALAHVLGGEAGAFVGKKCFEVIHGTREPWPMCPHIRALACGETVTEEFLEPRLGRYLQVSVSPRCDEQGRVLGTVHVAKDITARKEAEDALRQSEERLRFITESVVDVIWQLDRDFRFTYVSPSVKKMLGFTPEELAGTPVSSFLSSPSSDPLRELLSRKEAFAGLADREFTLELQLRAKDGTIVPAEAKFSCHLDERGEPVSYQGVARDLRDRKRGEQERQRLVAAIEHAAEGIFVAGLDRVIRYANKSLCAETGYSKRELLGKTMDLLASETNEASFYRQVRHAMKAGETWSGRYATKRKDGTSYWVEGSIVPVKDDSGLVGSYVCVTRDITEQLRLQEELRQVQKMEAMGALAGGIAHDFNNILGAILGNAELAMEDVPVDSPTHSNLQGVLKAGMRGRDLVRQILAFTKKTRTEKRPIPLTPLIRETHDLLRASIPATVEVALSMNAASDTVEADPVQVQQILLNLVTNAVDALIEEHGHIEISLSNASFGPDDPSPDKALQPGDYVALTISDTGRGMTDEVKRRIFEPFFSTKEPGRGTGMGLALVYGIVKDLKGVITVSSAIGRGAVFTVYFPRAKAPSRAKREKKHIIQQGRRERILFVDDEEPIVTVGMRMLDRLGYDVTTATDASDALGQFARSPNGFDVVITDQTMPGMTGLALTEELKRIRPTIPVILCSGRTDLLPPHQMKKLGISVCVTKPFTRSEMARAVLTALGNEETAE